MLDALTHVRTPLHRPRPDAATSSPRGDVTGLAAIPDEWIPSGTWRAIVSGPAGTDGATVTRTDSSIKVHTDSSFSPDMRVSDLGGGRIDLVITRPWPLPNDEMVGPAVYHDDTKTVHFDDEWSNRTADIWYLADKQVQMAIHTPRHADTNVFLEKTT